MGEREEAAATAEIERQAIEFAYSAPKSVSIAAVHDAYRNGDVRSG